MSGFWYQAGGDSLVFMSETSSTTDLDSVLHDSSHLGSSNFYVQDSVKKKKRNQLVVHHLFLSPLLPSNKMKEVEHYHEYQSSNDVLLNDALNRILQLPLSF